MAAALALTVGVALAGCARRDAGSAKDAAAPVPDAAVRAAPDAAAPAVHRFQAQLMGTPWSLAIVGDGVKAEAAAKAAFAEVARVEGVMSEWRPTSEVSRLNAAGGAPVVLSPELFDLLRRARDLGDRSGGAFDVTWAALRGVWDFDAGRVPAPDAVAAAKARIDYRRLALDAATRTATLPAGRAVGLGGIAKGHGIDRAAAVLREHGFSAFLVDGGGDLYVAGEKAPGQPWTVGVQHPRRRDELMVALPVRDAAVVTSGDYERFFEVEGRRYHHIIDPRTGMPADRSVAVTVRAADATFADALATALFVMGPERGVALAATLAGVDAAVLAADGRVVATSGLRDAFPARWREAR
jgi:thiamine biosynthesis lipoprotein